MKHEFVSHTGQPRLLLLFAGWAMDATPFRHVVRPGYDTLVVWDYRSLVFDWSVVTPYSEIVVIAWSLGVYAASMTLHAINSKVSAKIAVNGTLTPVDDMTGIPEAIYEGTAAGLTPRSLSKFFRRMCGDRHTTDRFMRQAPSRPIDELVDELRAIWPAPWFANAQVADWDRAVIGRDDAIFPACNQQRAWADMTTVTVVDRPHYIDLQEIADAYVIDKQRATATFEAGRATYDDNTPVQRDVVDGLMDDAAAVGLDRFFATDSLSCLEVGCGTGLLTRRLASRLTGGNLYMWDIGSCPPDGFDPARFRSCDAELEIRRTPPGRFDLVASASTVQWFNSPRRFLNECVRVIHPGGVLMLSGFMRGNMHQIITAAGVSLSLPDERQWRRMIPEGFETLSFVTLDYDLTFDSPVDVLRHLRLSGVNGLGRRSSALAPTAFVSRYPRMLDGLCHLTYRTVRMILKRKET